MFKLVSRSRSLLEGKGVGRRAAAKAPVTHVSDEPLHGGPEFVSDKALLHTTSYNDSVTPVDTSRNADQYASRPLPDTPPHKGNMADRPNTSSGPGSKKTPKSDFNFDKRMSRDDLHIGSKTYGRTRREPYPPFRGQPPPTPDASPKAAPTQRLATVTSNWKSTPDLLREAGSENIGMALGSPTHPPPVFSHPWNSQNATPPGKDSHVVSPPESRSSSVDTFDMPVTRKPSARWKLFGIFGRKQSDPPVPAISISDPNGLYGTNRPEEVIPDLNSPSRSNTTSSRKGPKHKPIVVRSQTMPLGVQGDGKFGRIPIALDTGAEPSPASRPLLNVDIPDVRMERYSVMFNSVLNSNPSLLSRRQANVPKLKSIEDVPGREEKEKSHGVARRATSPQPAARSSGLALFPSSRQGPNLVPQKLSPRLRSNTSPALLPSPSKATFNPKPLNYRRPSADKISSAAQPRHPSPRHHEKPGIAITVDGDSPTREPSLPPNQFYSDQSNLILDSPTELDSASGDDASSSVPWQAWRPAADYQPPEPKWQMLSPAQKTSSPPPPSSSTASLSSSLRKRSPSLASSSRTHVTQPSEDFDDVFPLDGAGPGAKAMTPVEISIARQISISRQQRMLLLQPLRTGSAAAVLPASTSPARRPSHPSPPRVAVGEAGRIAETKTSTPTLVHPPDLLDPHAARTLHRRSERIILEDA